MRLGYGTGQVAVAVFKRGGAARALGLLNADTNLQKHF